MYKAIEYVANGNADAVVSAGNSGCYIFGCYSLIKTIKNIDKPAFMSFFPTIKNKPLIFLDTGANKKCEGKDLYKFALMGDIYAKNVLKVKSPKIGVINIGTEANKGLEFHKVASELINENKTLNYVGFYEPRYILSGDIDVAVCDGYTGNIVVKTVKGSLKTLLNEMKKAFKKP
jgi:glycerol-3-phosphate acyltransferase PlsX